MPKEILYDGFCIGAVAGSEDGDVEFLVVHEVQD